MGCLLREQEAPRAWLTHPPKGLSPSWIRTDGGWGLASPGAENTATVRAGDPKLILSKVHSCSKSQVN